MWKFGLILFLPILVGYTAGQEQFLREVKNPSGPSVSILSGGGFSRDNGEDFGVQPFSAAEQQQPDQQFELVNQPQAIPFQSSQDSQQIPENGGSNNPFTNGEAGFGLRLTQAPAPAQQQSQPPPQQQPQVQQQQQPQLQQTPLSLPQLPEGQQYVDVYGRPIIFTQQHPQPQVSQPQPTQPPQVQTVPTQTQAFVDQYGRHLAHLQPVAETGVPVPVVHHHHQPVVQVEQAALPVVQEVIQPAPVPVAHNIVAPVVTKKVAHPALTFHTYAVPAVHKVGNLEIPFAQKLVYAKPLPLGAVIPPPVPAPAIVKSKNRTVFSPVEVVQPVVKESVHVAPAPVPVVHQHIPQPVLVQHPQNVLVEQHHHLPVLQQQQLVVPHPEQQLVQFVHQPVLAHQQLLHPVPHIKQIVQPQLVHAPPPVLLKKVVKQVIPTVTKIKTIVPEVTLIHQPVLSKALFQRHIFNVKHGSEPVIYQDLCTVYPYQKNLRACVLKKAVLPELHHPDIRTVNVEADAQQPQTQQTTIAGGSPIFVPAPQSRKDTPTVTVTKDPPQNIQETIRRESAKSKMQAAAATTPTTTVQPEAAESQDSSTTAKPTRRRKKGSETGAPKKEKEFKLV